MEIPISEIRNWYKPLSNNMSSLFGEINPQSSFRVASGRRMFQQAGLRLPDIHPRDLNCN
jgi:hypothetical protein